MTVEVSALGADGDGVAVLPGGAALYLPLTLPGERVEPGAVAPRGKGFAAEATVLTPSPHRVEPPCRHFGACGGCVVQHMDDAYYAAWKSGLVADAAGRLGFAEALPPLGRTPPGARRRIDLSVRRAGPALLLGLHARRSAEVVDMRECPVLHPVLSGVVAALRPVLRSLSGLRREGSALLNLLDTGPDLLLRTDAPLTPADRTRLAGLAQSCGITRVAWALGPRGLPEPACQLGPSIAAFGGRPTPVPPGVFLQASAQGEAAIVAAVLAALPARLGRGPIVELFAGCGSLTHALAARGRVLAVEGDAPAAAALRAAANPRVTVLHRDLARQPMQPPELKAASCVVLDPPFAGAPAQMQPLAASRKPVVYVSCSPAALLRDGRVLVQAGYRVASATAIDQFLWSARVESVVAFTPPR